MGKQYQMIDRVLARLANRWGSVRCYTCGEPIEVGDSVRSKTKPGGQQRIYHETCYEGMFIEV